MSRPGVMLDRFWGQVDKSPEHAGCWIWTGAYSQPRASMLPYGKYAGRGVAHRVAYQLEVGPIPDGLELDHLCNVSMCVNPAHLEPVTREENMRRRMERITHCKSNHALTPENCIGATKRCVTCARARSLAYYYRVRRPKLDVGRGERECKNGHERTPENTYVTPTGYRQCRECKRAKDRAYRAETRQLRAA